jgi:D-alanine-D-alanine ligase
VPPGEAYVSEINTIPGFTATSMFPKQAELAGIGFSELVARIIDLGLERARLGQNPAEAGEDEA